MTPLDFILWALAILIAVAVFVLIVTMITALVRMLTRKRDTHTHGRNDRNRR